MNLSFGFKGYQFKIQRQKKVKSVGHQSTKSTRQDDGQVRVVAERRASFDSASTPILSDSIEQSITCSENQTSTSLVKFSVVSIWIVAVAIVRSGVSIGIDVVSDMLEHVILFSMLLVVWNILMNGCSVFTHLLPKISTSSFPSFLVIVIQIVFIISFVCIGVLSLEYPMLAMDYFSCPRWQQQCFRICCARQIICYLMKVTCILQQQQFSSQLTRVDGLVDCFIANLSPKVYCFGSVSMDRHGCQFMLVPLFGVYFLVAAIVTTVASSLVINMSIERNSIYQFAVLNLHMLVLLWTGLQYLFINLGSVFSLLLTQDMEVASVVSWTDYLRHHKEFCCDWWHCHSLVEFCAAWNRQYFQWFKIHIFQNLVTANTQPEIAMFLSGSLACLACIIPFLVSNVAYFFNYAWLWLGFIFSFGIFLAIDFYLINQGWINPPRSSSFNFEEMERRSESVGSELDDNTSEPSTPPTPSEPVPLARKSSNMSCAFIQVSVNEVPNKRSTFELAWNVAFLLFLAYFGGLLLTATFSAYNHALVSLQSK